MSIAEERKNIRLLIVWYITIIEIWAYYLLHTGIFTVEHTVAIVMAIANVLR